MEVTDSEADQASRLCGRTAEDAVAHDQGDEARSIDDHHGATAVEHCQPDRLLGLEHERPVEEHVR